MDVAAEAGRPSVEQLLDQFRSSTWGWVRATLAGWATIALGIAGVVLTSLGAWDRWPMLLTGLAFLIVLWKWLENLSSRFDLSQDRLVVRRGLFMKSLDEVELYRVKDIRLDFSLINQLAGIGTVTITSSDETTRSAPLVLPHIEGALRRREELRRLVDTARQKRRVREIDMVDGDF
jgi:uncharacterized membrane protein YdbT with pleckstrin-like domain